MLSGIKDRAGIIVITGEAGVGKTILVYRLLKDRTEKTRTAFVFNPTLDLRGILENIFYKKTSTVEIAEGYAAND